MRDLIFTLGLNNFSSIDVMLEVYGVMRKHTNHHLVSLFQDSEIRERAIKLYLDDEICSNRDGSKDLSLYLVGDMTKNARRGGL